MDLQDPASITYKTGKGSETKQSFMFWYTDWRTKHESSVLTEDMLGKMGVG